jgi:hypothetical protein
MHCDAAQPPRPTAPLQAPGSTPTSAFASQGDTAFSGHPSHLHPDVALCHKHHIHTGEAVGTSNAREGAMVQAQTLAVPACMWLLNLNYRFNECTEQPSSNIKHEKRVLPEGGQLPPLRHSHSAIVHNSLEVPDKHQLPTQVQIFTHQHPKVKKFHINITPQLPVKRACYLTTYNKTTYNNRGAARILSTVCPACLPFNLPTSSHSVHPRYTAAAAAARHRSCQLPLPAQHHARQAVRRSKESRVVPSVFHRRPTTPRWRPRTST